ncbi:hypothetical protein [uncultured Aquimarina sp.]|uniref:hypothetical protein n=1 Tax=uncultured Aquimarina sp. TaxID=575652 RepID=UPI002609F2FA|nr:hypothetical protein [uncultured Aquimarina sp.]
MKRIGLIVFLLAFVSVKSQVTMTFTEPKKMEAKKFTQVTVYTKSDSIIKGYGFINIINYSSHAVRFIKSKPITEFIKQEDWSSFYAENLTKIEIEHESKVLELYPVKSGESFGLTFFYHKIHENNSVKLYCPPYSIPYINKGKCVYTVLKNGEEKARQVLMKLSDKPKKMPKRANKFFDDCPVLQQKIEAGEYQKSLKGLIAILDFYDVSCQK